MERTGSIHVRAVEIWYDSWAPPSSPPLSLIPFLFSWKKVWLPKTRTVRAVKNKSRLFQPQSARAPSLVV